MVCGRLQVRAPIGYNQRLLNWYLFLRSTHNSKEKEQRRDGTESG